MSLEHYSKEGDWKVFYHNQVYKSLDMKMIKYEIRLGKPNRPIDEPNGPMFTSPKKVEPILRVGS